MFCCYYTLRVTAPVYTPPYCWGTKNHSKSTALLFCFFGPHLINPCYALQMILCWQKPEKRSTNAPALSVCMVEDASAKKGSATPSSTVCPPRTSSAVDSFSETLPPSQILRRPRFCRRTTRMERKIRFMILLVILWKAGGKWIKLTRQLAQVELLKKMTIIWLHLESIHFRKAGTIPAILNALCEYPWMQVWGA